MTNQPLSHLNMLVTRPADQAESLCQAIVERGGRAYHVAALDIVPVEPRTVWRRCLTTHLCRVDWAIFVSVHAVHQAFVYGPPAFLKACCVAAIGPTTRQTLEFYGQEVMCCPEHPPFNSEALLAMPAMQEMNGQRVLLLAGWGGRVFLQYVLLQRGAWVSKIALYRRQCQSSIKGKDFIALLQAKDIDLVVSTSPDGLHCLSSWLSIEGGAEALERLHLLVVGSKMVNLAQRWGWKQPPILAQSARTQDIVDSLVDWTQRRAIDGR